MPAAIKGAKRAGAGTDPNVLLLNSVDDVYVNLAEEKIIPKAHQRSYIKRLKATVSAISDDQTGVQLTDDSEGEGGDDTSKYLPLSILQRCFVLGLTLCFLFYSFRGIAWFLYCCHSGRCCSSHGR